MFYIDRITEVASSTFKIYSFEILRMSKYIITFCCHKIALTETTVQKKLVVYSSLECLS